MSSACSFCGHDINAHDPVFVTEMRGGDRIQTGQFCNYACLARYVEEENLESGACCHIPVN